MRTSSFTHSTQLGFLASPTPFLTGRPFTLFRDREIHSSGAVGICLPSPVSQYDVEYPHLTAITEPLTVTSAGGNLVHSLDDENPARLIISAMDKHNLSSLGNKTLYKEDQFYLGVLDGDKLHRLYQIMSGGPSRGTVSLEGEDAPQHGVRVRLLLSTGAWSDDGNHDQGGEHGHTHEHLDNPGKFSERDMPNYQSRSFEERGFTVGIGGPVGSGKTALTLALCQRMRADYNIATVTNDIFTREDQEFLIKNKALPASRILAIETGGCPHAAIREDISANMGALETLQAKFGCQLLFVESGGDNLAANYSRELADYIIYVIDVAGGDKIPRKGGPGISQSDLLVINKIDLAPYVGASLEVMQRDSKLMRGDGPTLFTSVRKGDGVSDVVDLVLAAWRAAGSPGNPGGVPTE
ncbi:hypothetical protein EUX98_g6166 [Antrodiella citrinella]|uniref:CobW/HypB/UreG nucleotide-binding domain-containing protein n=1 Tax=Antrodiella citrinella TaxID=2447956 RepID=A0A4S4MPN5_9APHY|nr:hypothetical protein EUX98_g6166 [Antrodiella citrinella]